MTLIAEIGQNHDGDMGRAMALIDAAADNGADVAKFQLYDAQALFPKEGNPWFDYNCRTELTRDQVTRLAEHCAARGIEFMASVFDRERIAWLEALGVARYKIASRSIFETALIEAAAATGKPIIVSLGRWKGPGLPMIAAPGGVAFLYCIAEYPAPLESLRLGEVDFSVIGGFSDHSLGTEAALCALARGARILEKHFTLDKSAYGPDHAGSMTPDELAEIARFAISARACLGPTALGQAA